MEHCSNIDEEWEQFILNNVNKNDTYSCDFDIRSLSNSRNAFKTSASSKMSPELCCDASHLHTLTNIKYEKNIQHINKTTEQQSLYVSDDSRLQHSASEAPVPDKIYKSDTPISPILPIDIRNPANMVWKANAKAPICEDLYISTKTKVLFLNREIDIHRIFWEIPVIEYWKQKEGVIKKQMKIVSKTPNEYEEYKAKLEGVYYYNENIIKQINNPSARRIKFKDERKITIGISKKDILNSRIKVKNAFYNCFAIIFRFLYENQFREIHVKIFNTGKLEIPGILNIQILEIVKRMILDILIPNIKDDEKPLEFVENKKNDNVLINSNFNCGYFINREKLHAILKSPKYGIETSYDPCSYPGVKCKFYFNNELGTDNLDKQTGCIMQEDRNMKMSEKLENKKYTEVSFMIFRTGSCLIVGNCSESILTFIYKFIRDMFEREYKIISIQNEDPIVKNKNGKIRKKTITVSNEYYHKTRCGSVEDADANDPPI